MLRTLASIRAEFKSKVFYEIISGYITPSIKSMFKTPLKAVFLEKVLFTNITLLEAYYIENRDVI
jgi:hypothetical protein